MKVVGWLGIFLYLLVVLLPPASASYLSNSSNWDKDIAKVVYPSLALGDVDNDGDLDLALSGGGTLELHTEIYENTGVNFTNSSKWGKHLVPVDYGSLAWGDVNNDGWLDLILTGCNSGASYSTPCSVNDSETIVYINNQTTLNPDSSWKGDLQDVSMSAIALGDLDLDGDLDLVLTGRNDSQIETSKVYLNNGSLFEENTSWGVELTATEQSGLALVDIDNDGDLDLFLSGDNSVSKFSRSYVNNGTTLVEDTVFQSLRDSSWAVGDADNDGDMDVQLIGCCDEYYLFRNTNGTLSTWLNHPNHLTGKFAGSVIFGDYDNNGYLDMVGTGRETRTELYLFNLSTMNYTKNIQDPEPNLPDLEYSTQAFGDVDLDGDLDLIMTGTDGSSYFGLVFINNITTPNSMPDPPDESSLTATFANESLTLTWANASDAETPSLGLYYNLRVGTSPGGHEIVTGVYGGGEDNGYMGNMMQRRNITLKVNVSGTIYWAVQTIDAGLRAGNWTTEQTLTPSTPPPWSSPLNVSPSSYDSNITTNITVTWTGASSAVLEHNFTGTVQNVSMSKNGNIYNYSIVLPAGTYSWRSCGTNGQWNCTPPYAFAIARGTPTLALTLDGNAADASVDTGDTVSIAGSLSTGDPQSLELYFDGSLMNNATSPSNTTSTLSTGTYNVTLLYRESQNYSLTTLTRWITASVAVVPPSGGGGGGGGGVPSNPSLKEVTYSSPRVNEEHKTFVTSSTMAVTEAAFTNIVSAQDVKFSIAWQNASEVENPVENAYQYLNITLTNLYQHELSDAWISFKVSKSWLHEVGVERDEIRLFRQTTGWNELDTRWEKETDDYDYFKATTPGFSIFAIALAQPKPEPITNETIENVVNNTNQSSNRTVENQVNSTTENTSNVPPIKPKPKLLPWLTAIFVFSLSIAIAIMRYRRAPLEKEGNSEVPPSLRDYVRKSRTQGFSDEEIRKKLLETGWKENQIEQALNSY